MNNQLYDEAEGVRRSDLYTLYTKTPLHFKYQIENREEPTASLTFGSAAHKYILEKESFYDEYAVLPVCDRRTKEGKEIYNAFMELAKTKTLISADDFMKIKEMDEQIDRTPLAREFLTGITEKPIFWTDVDTGIKCKVKPDCLSEVLGVKYIVDYKTTDSCADGHFEKSVRKYGYKFQAGMYREGVFQNEFEDYNFAFVAQEKTAPYAVRIYICSEAFIQEGYDQFKEALGKYKYCVDNNNFYGYEGPFNTSTILVEEGE